MTNNIKVPKASLTQLNRERLTLLKRIPKTKASRKFWNRQRALEGTEKAILRIRDHDAHIVNVDEILNAAGGSAPIGKSYGYCIRM